MHRRVSFWWSVFKGAYSWLTHLADHWLRLVAVVTLFGTPLVILVVHHGRNIWLVAVSIGAVLVLALGESAYRAWDEAEQRIEIAVREREAVETEIRELHDSVRDALGLEAVSVRYHVNDLAGGQNSHDIWIRIRLVNTSDLPIGWEFVAGQVFDRPAAIPNNAFFQKKFVVSPTMKDHYTIRIATLGLNQPPPDVPIRFTIRYGPSVAQNYSWEWTKGVLLQELPSAPSNTWTDVDFLYIEEKRDPIEP